MPDGLEELYRQALDRIKRQTGDDGILGMRILSWITHARRPLSVDELRHGPAVGYDMNDEKSPAEFDEDNLLPPGSLVDVCAGLIILESSSQIIRLVHFTTQEYFDKARLHLFKDAEVDISRACLTYLSYNIGTQFKTRKGLIETLQSYPFLEYAFHYWFLHVKTNLMAENPNDVLLDAVAHLKNSDRIAISIEVLNNLICGFYQYHKFDLLLEICGAIESKTCPLEFASRMGLEELATVLLNRRTGSSPVLKTSFLLASSLGHFKVAKLLQKYGASANRIVDIDI